MMTISRELENAFGLSPLYSKEGQGFNATVLAMFVLPGSSACWMATEAERQPNGDWVFFGYCHIHEWEWGYFSFSELAELDLHGYVVEALRIQPDKLKVIDCYNAFRKVAG